MSRRRFIGSLVTKASLLSSLGCGTVLHPERRGQPAGTLDWKIVAFDAVGLLLFFVPGVIAFAVDFNNGTIYLPPDHYGLNNANGDEAQLFKVSLPDERMTARRLEEIVSKHTERDIELVPGVYRTKELGNIDEFWPTTDKLAALR